MRFWDSSAIVSLLVPQPSSAAAERLVASDADIVIWWATPVECISALMRLQREGKIDERDSEIVIRRLDSLLERSDSIEPVNMIRDQARRLLRVHTLRAADALQLSAALELRGAGRGGVEFVSFDSRLATAARREGFTVP